MRDFSGKRIIGSATLGERLARLRQEERYTLEQMASQLNIQPSYLEALEAGQYQKLPGEVYIKSFLKRYAEYLQVNSEMVLRIYEKEKQIIDKTQPVDNSVKLPESIITPKKIRYGIIGLVVVAILIYLSWQIQMIFVPPGLFLDSPEDNLTTSQSTVIVAGSTDKEANLEINGQAVLVDSDGRFSKIVDLQEGVNIIRISVAKERSQKTVIERKILYKKDDGDNN